MRKLIFIFFYLFPRFLCSGQNTTFERGYDFGGAEAAYCVKQTPDSGFVICGRQGLGLISAKILAMKTDKSGNIEWSKLYGDGSNEQYAYHIVNCRTGGYAMVGYKTGAGFVEDIYVLRLNNAGDTIWTKNYGTSAVEIGSCIKETVDSGFVISFYDGNDSTGILKIDSIGNVLWWKKYYLGSQTLFKDVSLLSSGGYLLSGVSFTATSLSDQAVLMRTDSMGDSLWVKSFGGVGGDQFFQSQETADNNIIAGGISGATTSDPYNFYLVKTDMNGDTLWTKHIYSALNQECYSLQECSDAGFIMLGTTYLASDANIILVKTNSVGDSVWTHAYGCSTGDDYGYFVQQTFDGGFVCAGLSGCLDADGAAAYLLKTNSSGTLLSVSEVDAGTLELSAYPNPTNGMVHFKINNPNDLKVEINDELGQEAFSADFDDRNTDFVINFESFRNGIYFVKITTSEGYSVKRIIKTN